MERGAENRALSRGAKPLNATRQENATKKMVTCNGLGKIQIHENGCGTEYQRNLYFNLVEFGSAKFGTRRRNCHFEE